MRITGNVRHDRVDLEEGPLLWGAFVTSKATGSETDDSNMIEVPAGGTYRLDALRDRSPDVVIGQRLRQSIGAVGDLFGTVHSRTVIKEPVIAIDRIDHLVNAEEAARGFNPVEAWLPKIGQDERQHDKAKYSGRVMALHQDEHSKRNAHDLEREFRRCRQVNVEK